MGKMGKDGWEGGLCRKRPNDTGDSTDGGDSEDTEGETTDGEGLDTEGETTDAELSLVDVDGVLSESNEIGELEVSLENKV